MAGSFVYCVNNFSSFPRSRCRLILNPPRTPKVDCIPSASIRRPPLSFFCLSLFLSFSPFYSPKQRVGPPPRTPFPVPHRKFCDSFLTPSYGGLCKLPQHDRFLAPFPSKLFPSQFIFIPPRDKFARPLSDLPETLPPGVCFWQSTLKFTNQPFRSLFANF